MFSGRTLLVTGGTGSFGNAVLRRFMHTGISKIRVFSLDEKKQEDMRLELCNDSHDTERLKILVINDKLLALDYVKDELSAPRSIVA